MRHAAKHCRDRFGPAMHGLLASHPEVTPEQAAAAMLAALQALDPTKRRRVEERLLVLGLATVWENTRLVARRNEP